MESGVCADCVGALATKTWDEGADYAFWTMQPGYTPVCEMCWTRRDNYDPPDPDGEDLFRDYQAEQRDAAEAARRLK